MLDDIDRSLRVFGGSGGPAWRWFPHLEVLVEEAWVEVDEKFPVFVPGEVFVQWPRNGTGLDAF